MADPYVRQARGVFTGTAGSTDIPAGDMVYFDGDDWELADATDNTKYAEAMAVEAVSSGEVGVYCRSGILVDIDDTAYTQGDQYYLSETAGGITNTYILGSTTAEALVQLVGFGLSTNEVYIDIPPLRVVHESYSFPYLEANTSNDVDGDFMGKGLPTVADAVGFSFEMPRNLIKIEEARLWWCGTGTALDTSDTYTIDVSGGIDDETTTATYGGITAAALTVAANDLAVADVTAAFDETGLQKPGNVTAVDVNKAAEGSGGDDPIMLCVSIVFVVC